MTDLKQLAEAVSGTIKAWVAERLRSMEAGLPDLVRKHIAELPKPLNGKDADPADIERAAKAAVSALPVPDFAPLVRAEVGRAETTLKATIALEVRAAVDKLPSAQPGRDADQPAIVSQLFDLVMRAMPKPRDGTSVTLDDVKPLLEAALQAWELRFERRCQDVLERLAERHKGKDGLDGFRLDDIELELKDGRQLLLSLRGAEREVERSVMLLGLPIYRGIYRSAGDGYEAGDLVTYGGSVWIALKDTTEAPKGPADAWRLVVKGGK